MIDDDEADVEAPTESGLSPEHDAIKAKVEASKLDFAERARAAAAARKAEKSAAAAPTKRPKEFNPNKAPTKGFPVKLSDEDWQTIHGPTPNRIWLKRGLDAAPDHEVKQVDTPCQHCGAIVHKLFKGVESCLGCGAPPSEE